MWWEVEGTEVIKILVYGRKAERVDRKVPTSNLWVAGVE